jgi:cation diffusion facilitator CzcD-associated flavoprotein CzcO
MSTPPTSNDSETSLDVLVIGAGISGINAAYHLQTELPHCRFAVLEARDNIGGTWDLFRYPGIRSDSDLYTFGFTWHKWNRSNPIAEGRDILEYLDDAITTHRLKDHFLFNHRVVSLEWSQHQWTARVQHADADIQFHSRFIIFATGYYDYDQPLPAIVPGLDTFQGQIIHPQFWPETFDYTDKRIVVIGSGATAVTLIPKLAERAELVTMLQRSPSYIAAVPNPATQSWLARLLPKSCIYYLRRIRALVFGQLFFRFCRRFPNAARSLLERRTLSRLPVGTPLSPHFKPRYNPWDQRLCASPDGDFFKALASRKAAIETDTISTVDKTGIQLASGKRLDADVLITATGLNLQIGGGIPVSVNGEPLDVARKYIWNGLMLQDVPNAALVFGYVNASWTLGADAAMRLTCRLLKHLEDNAYKAAVPILDKGKTEMETRPLLDLNSTYLTRAQDSMPKASVQRPWVSRTNYFADMLHARFGDLGAGLDFVR